MRILQIIDSLHVGGAEKLIVDSVPLMVKKGNKVDVLLLNSDKTPFYKELENTNTCTISSLGNSFYNPLYIFKIIKFLKNYDVIHVHLFPAQYYAVLAKVLSFSKVKLIFTEHNTSNRRLEMKLLKFIEKFIYARYGKIVCISNEVKDVLKEKLSITEEKLILIQNGINIENINKSIGFKKSQFGFNNKDIVIAMVAGFRVQKDHETLLKAINKLPNHYKLILIGDGERKQIVQNLVRDLRLEDRVQLLGIRSDVYSLYKMVDIAVLSSHWEGFGISAAEAMACGLPTIGSNVEGLSQVIGDQDLLFQKGNVEDLVSKIEALEFTEYYNIKAQKAKEKAQNFSINNMVDNLLILYNKL